MKYIFLIVMFITFSVYSAGFKGGIFVSVYNYEKANESKITPGISIGGIENFDISQSFSFNVELLLNVYTKSFGFTEKEGNDNFHYYQYSDEMFKVEIPVYAKCNVYKFINIYAGISYNIYNGVSETACKCIPPEDAEFEIIHANYNMHKQFNILGGVEFNFDNFFIDLRYKHPLNSIYTNDNVFENQIMLLISSKY